MTKPRVPLSLVVMLACGAQLMVVLDGLIVSVALADMRSDLSLSVAAQQWIVDAYLVTFGGLLLLAGRACDLLGHRRVFLAGTAVFSLASLAGGLAPNGATLIAARLIQGAGAAALAPSSLSLLTATYSGEQRARAVSIWSATSGSAGALGLALGGVITSGLGWRWVLLVNVPVGVALWVLASTALAPARPGQRRRIDLTGALTITVGVGALTFAISRGQDAGWTSIGTVVALGGAVAALGLFLAAEQRTSEPLVPLSIFRRHGITIANIVIALLGAAMTATLVFLCLYQQQILGLSPLRTGLSLLPMSAVLTLGALACKPLLARYGARHLIVAGGLVMTAGTLWLADLPGHGDYTAHLLGPTLVWAAGAGIVTMPAVALATADVDPGQAGLASALVNTARQVAGAIGLAILTSISAAATPEVGHTTADTVHGYRIALAGAAVLVALAALVAAMALMAPCGTTTRSRRTLIRDDDTTPRPT